MVPPLYNRMQGPPKVYDSPYPVEYLDAFAGRLAKVAIAARVWCLLENTVPGEATADVLVERGRLGGAGDPLP